MTKKSANNVGMTAQPPHKKTFFLSNGSISGPIGVVYRSKTLSTIPPSIRRSAAVEVADGR